MTNDTTADGAGARSLAQSAAVSEPFAMLRQRSQDLGRRYTLAFLLAALPLVLLVAALAWVQLESQRESLLQGLARSAAERRLALDAVFKAADDHVMAMKRSAEDELSGALPSTPSPLRTHLAHSPADAAARVVDGVFLDAAATAGWQDRAGNLVGVPDLLERDPADQAEVDMALGLMRQMHLAHLTTPFLRWSYYFSASRGFLTFYPFTPSSELVGGAGHKSVPAMIESWLAYDIFKDGTPARDPTRTDYWTRVYLDAGGAGWMISHGAPVYVGDSFKGVVGTDILLGFLDRFLDQSRLPLGRSWIVDDQGEILASGDGGIPEGAKVPLLADHLPAPLGRLPMAELLQAGPAFRGIDGFYLMAGRTSSAPWTILTVVPRSDVDAQILPRLGPYLVILVALGLMLALGQWLLQRLFVAPALALGDQVAALARGRPTPSPRLPTMWRPLRDAVTAAFAARAEVETLNARFVAATESFPDGLAILDADDRFVYWNGRYPDHLTANLREVLAVGKKFEDWLREGLAQGPIYHPDLGPEWVGRRLAFRREDSSDHEHRLIDGRWMRIRENRMPDGGTVLLSTDITSRKAEREALDDQRRKLEAVLANIAEGVNIVDREARVVLANPGFLDLYDFPPELAAPGMPLERFVRHRLERQEWMAGEGPGQSLDELVAARVAHFLAAPASRFEESRPDGRLIMVQRQRLPDGLLISTYSDITELRRRERELAVMARALEQAGDSVEIATADYKLIFVNPAFSRLTGWSGEEAIGRTPGDLLRSDWHDAAFFAEIDRTTRAGEVWSGRLVSRHKDGHLLHQDAVVSPLFDEQGVLTHFVCVKRDITERERAAEALRASERRYRAVVEGQSEFILRLTPEGILTFVNDAYCRYRGQSREQLLGGFDDVAHYEPDEQAVIRDAWSRLTEASPTASYQLLKRLADGTARYEHWTDTAIFGPDGQVAEIQAVGRDITEQRIAEEALKASEQRYRAVVQDQTELIGRFDADFKLIFANAMQCRLRGKTEAELLGEDFFDTVPERIKEPLRQRMLALTPEDPVDHGENEKILPNGEVRWFAFSNRALFDERGMVTGYQSVGRDITGQKAAERALKDSEARLAQFMQNAPVGMYVKDLDGRYVLANPEMAKVFGRPAGTIVGLQVEDVLPAEDAALVRDYDRELIERGVPTIKEEYIEGLDAYAWSMVIRFPIRDAQGRIVQIGGFDVDITPQKRVEQRLKESEARLRLIAEGVPVTIAITRFDAPEVLFANQRHGETFGHLEGRQAEGIAASWERLEERALLFARVQREGSVEGFETDLRRHDGSLFSALISARSMTFEGQPAVLMAITDITDQRRMERQVRESEARLGAFMQNAPVGMYLKDLAGRYVLANREMAKVFGRPIDEMLGGTAADTRVGYDLGVVASADLKVLGTGQPLVVEEFAPELEAYRWSMVIRFPIRGQGGDITHIGGFHVDITPQKKAEAEIARQRDVLYQTEKMSALGSLLAGVAHELNNPLSVVVGYSAMLEELAADEPSRKRAERVHAAAERCARIVKTFLAMARQRPPQRGPVEINGVVEAALELAAYGLRTAGIVVVRELAEGLPPVWGDTDQLHQVLANLIVNAQHAMEQVRRDRRLTVATRLDGTNVLITVRDNGHGMDPEVQKRIFEPFFTTKPQGVGTGVGLSLCHAIIGAHEGSIEVESAPDAGAAFHLRLPVALAADLPTVRVEAALPGPAIQARVLVVDDEPEIAELVGLTLARNGIEVVTALSGRQALARIAEGRFDLVISDLRMPDIDGPALWQELCEREPALAARFLFITGDTLGAEVNRFLAAHPVPVMEKPLDLLELQRHVRERLADMAAH